MMPLPLFFLTGAVALVGATIVRVANWYVNPPRVHFQATDGYDQVSS